jgi:hypothetical protein
MEGVLGIGAARFPRLFCEDRGAMNSEVLWIAVYPSHYSSEIEPVLELQSIIVQTQILSLVPPQPVTLRGSSNIASSGKAHLAACHIYEAKLEVLAADENNFMH